MSTTVHGSWTGFSRFISDVVLPRMPLSSFSKRKSCRKSSNLRDIISCDRAGENPHNSQSAEIA